MKKFLILALTAIMGLSVISCGNKKVNSKESSVSRNKSSNNMKIVAGSVAVAEMLTKLNIDIIGRPTTQHEISDEIKKLPQIGLPMNPDLEKIKALNPDVYITAGSLQEMIGDKLDQNGIDTIFADLDSYDKVKDTIIKISKKFDREEMGKKLIEEIEQKEKKVLEDIDTNKKVKVMILFGAPGHFMLASKNSFVGSLIEKLGAENIASKVNFKGQYVPFSLEAALGENPDVILRMYHGYVEEAKKQVDHEFSNNPQWKKFKAIKSNRVYDLNTEYFPVTGNIKAVEALNKMKDILYK